MASLKKGASICSPFLGLFFCVSILMTPIVESSSTNDDVATDDVTGETASAEVTDGNSNNTTAGNDPSANGGSQNETKGPHGEKHPHHSVEEKEKEPNYRNPFSYLPKPFVFAMIFIGAFLLMIFVLGVVTVTRSYVCPRYGRFVDSHPRLKEVMPKWHLTRATGSGRKNRRQSATESHLELPKVETEDGYMDFTSMPQDSLDNITAEMDNESFLASLENVNFSVTPPSTRRNNFGGGHSRSSLHPIHSLSNSPSSTSDINNLSPLGVSSPGIGGYGMGTRGSTLPSSMMGPVPGDVIGRDSRYVYPQHSTNDITPFAGVNSNSDHDSLYL